jgi:predicted Zn-dependent peptidase
MKTFQYPNGFRMVYEKPNTNIPLTSIIVFVKLGSIYETDGIRGVSHFIEHMCFKGTKRHPNSKVISHNYDRTGAFFNAYTDKEYTNYEIKCDEKHFESSIQMLSDMIMNSQFNKKEFEKEHQVIIEENITSQDDPEEIVTNNSEAILYEGTPYQFEIDALSYHKKQFLKYEDVVNTYHSYYVPQRMVVSVVSHIPFSKIKSVLKSSFFVRTPYHNPIYYEPPVYLHPLNEVRYNLKKKSDISAIYLRISFRTCTYESTDKYALDLLSKIIGTPFSSRLFTILREDNGLTYSSESTTTHYSHSGDFSIFITLNPKKLLKNGEKKGVLPLVVDLLNDLYMNGVHQDELIRFKGYVKGKHQIDLEDSLNKCEYNGKNVLLYGENFTLFHKLYETHYHSILKKELDLVIKKYFKKSNMVFCLFGNNIPSLETIKNVVERFSG